MKAMRPDLVLGASALTHPGPQEHVDSVLMTARELGIKQLDTSPVDRVQHTIGHSERQLGLASATKRGFTINTSVEFNSHGRCPLNRGQVWQSVKSSLQRLEVQQVDILYIHAPDSEALLEQQSAAMDDLYRQGKFKRVSMSSPKTSSFISDNPQLGLANFSIPMLKDYLTICHQKSYVLPSVYLLAYNLLWRFPESKLIPFLRSNSITLMAQSPLAGGMLTGRFAP
jgi:aflatoxin B1 aldehyde reductase